MLYFAITPYFFFFFFQDDPKAHEKFLKITRAYEVLKDDQLRKKYDLHGEEGLKEDFQGGQHYESWSFYQEEFGKLKLFEFTGWVSKTCKF